MNYSDLESRSRSSNPHFQLCLGVRNILIVQRRLQYGQYETLMQELDKDVGYFKVHLRITPDVFDEEA
jgi:hypothetical protein